MRSLCTHSQKSCARPKVAGLAIALGTLLFGASGWTTTEPHLRNVNVRPAKAAAELTCQNCESSVQRLRYLDLAAWERVSGGGAAITGRAELSDQEYFSFSGVGALVCTAAGKRHTATAFLVGSFDLVVTVAHPFADDEVKGDVSQCVYTTTDSIGQIRERIPVAYVKSQWELEPGAFGQPSKDLAVVRLAQRSTFAQRTMPLGRFPSTLGPVAMIGFRADIDADTLKRKARGSVYAGTQLQSEVQSFAAFTHDMDARDIADGAPVIDEQTGVIIGIHTSVSPQPQLAQASQEVPQTRSVSTYNALIPMTEWLERILKAEIEATPPEPSN